MGTSRNDPSPRTPIWKPALAILGRPEIPVDQQVIEVWRAAAQERGEQFISDLAHPALAAAQAIFTQRASVDNALESYDRVAMHATAPTLSIEMGRRALVRSLTANTSFASELFGEAIGYYVSRDLPSVVAAHGRVKNVSEAIKLKDQIRQYVKQRVSEAGTSRPGAAGWKSFVSNIISSLQRREGEQ